MRGLFFLLSILGIVLAINVNLVAKPKPSVFPTVDQFEMQETEGLVANFFVEDVKNDEELAVECPCNGSKKIKSGDGLIEMECPCLKNGQPCKCGIGVLPPTEDKPIEVEVAPEASTPVEPAALLDGNPFSSLKKKHVIIYIKAKWCGPCHWVHQYCFPELQKFKWGKTNFAYKIGPEITNDVIVVDFDEKQMNYFREFVGEKLDNITLPVFYKIDVENRKIIEKLVGPHTSKSFHKFYTHEKD